MLSYEDKKFIYDKSISIHPAYILDELFKKNIDKDNIEEFILQCKDPHYLITFNLNKINTASNFNFIYELNNNIAYCKIPTFTIISPKNLLNFLNKIKNNNHIKNIIIDLRNNGGGNSVYAELIIKKLYGLDMLNYVNYKWNKNIKFIWRKSTDLIDRLISYDNKSYNKLINNLINTDEDIYITKPKINKVNKPVNLLKNKKIYLYINENCGSSCLNCIDYFKIIKKNIILVGDNPTNYSTDYSEIIDFILPSKKARLIIPTKKIIGRIRISYITVAITLKL
jgi:hypothetical protein